MPVILVEDNGPFHVIKAALAALEARKHWLTVERRPNYAPELNNIEVVHYLKAHHLARKTFTGVAVLDKDIQKSTTQLTVGSSRCTSSPVPRTTSRTSSCHASSASSGALHGSSRRG